jgi:hypothetical protein
MEIKKLVSKKEIVEYYLDNHFAITEPKIRQKMFLHCIRKSDDELMAELSFLNLERVSSGKFFM